MTLHPILLECCGEKTSYDLTRPFRWGHWAFATDGRIMVRQANAAELVPLEKGRKVPDPDRIMVDHACPTIRVLIPQVAETIQCNTCTGTGSNMRGELVCEECGAVYRITLEGEPLSLPNCEPVRVAESPNVYFQARYLGLLHRYGVREIMIPNDLKFPATFTGDGFEGWLMAMDTKGVEKDWQESR